MRVFSDLKNSLPAGSVNSVVMIYFTTEITENTESKQNAPKLFN